MASIAHNWPSIIGGPLPVYLPSQLAFSVLDGDGQGGAILSQPHVPSCPPRTASVGAIAENVMEITSAIARSLMRATPVVPTSPPIYRKD